MIFDVIIVGAGPAGSTAALYLGKAGKKVLLIDKAEFPREKICGDAQGRKALSIIKELGLYEAYKGIEGQEIYGITLSSPNGTTVEFDVESRDKPAPGYTHKRKVFDNFLFQNAKKMVETKILNVEDIIVENGNVKGIVGVNKNNETERIYAKIVLAADGALSVLARKFGIDKNPPEHFITAVRTYFKGVTGMTDRIEIHVLKELVPGYFWIFPLPNDEANVGLGMIVKDMAKKKIVLKDALLRIIKEHPLFVERFKNAQMLEEVKGWSLPIASFKRKCYGNGILFLGDAAGLIDPLSGEGVGNAMISGRIASIVCLEALEKNSFHEAFLKRYDKLLWNEIGEEIKINYRLQRLGKMFPGLIDKLLDKAKKDENFKKKVEAYLPNAKARKKLASFDFLSILSPSIKKEDVEEGL